MEEKKITDVRIGEYLTKDVSACVGTRSHVYIDKFYKIHDHGYSFNWCAALFTQTWFGYRKMWKAAAAVTCLNLILSMISQALTILYLPNVPIHSFKYVITGTLAITLILFVVCGIAGDWYYCKHVTNVLDENGCKSRPAVDDPELEDRLHKAGGVSLMGLFVVWGINLALGRIVAWVVTEVADRI